MLDSEKEIIEMIIKYKLPDVEKYNHVSYDVNVGDCIFDKNVIRFLFFRVDTGTNLEWQYCRTFLSFRDGFCEKSYKEIIEKEIEIYKSVYENPKSKQYKGSK